MELGLPHHDSRQLEIVADWFAPLFGRIAVGHSIVTGQTSVLQIDGAVLTVATQEGTDVPCVHEASRSSSVGCPGRIGGRSVQGDPDFPPALARASIFRARVEQGGDRTTTVCTAGGVHTQSLVALHIFSAHSALTAYFAHLHACHIHAWLKCLNRFIARVSLFSFSPSPLS